MREEELLPPSTRPFRTPSPPAAALCVDLFYRSVQFLMLQEHFEPIYSYVQIHSVRDYYGSNTFINLVRTKLTGA